MAQTLREAALEVLNEPDPFEKARIGEAVAERWLRGDISAPYLENGEQLPPPDRPARLSTVKLVPSHLMPKLGKGGSLQSRQAIIHSLVHTESWAIDLSWDIIARFGKEDSMPRDFFTDFVKVAQDEGRHFMLLATRLKELGSFYGAFPAHDGLWDSAVNTSKSLLARLAIEHCVHEARGLDVLPTTISRLRNGGDDSSADLLETVVYPEEITHCAAGIKWFKFLCHRSPISLFHGSECVASAANIPEKLKEGNVDRERRPVYLDETSENGVIIDENEMVIQTFHDIVRKYFRGTLKPPFNRQARSIAGFDVEWYEPLTVKVKMQA